jgi:arginyl-tRNA synthetase
VPERLSAVGLDALAACEDVLAAHDALERCASIEPRRHEQQDADLRLLFADRMWLQSPVGKQLLVALERHPSVASAQRRKSAVLLRFEDALLAQLEQHMASGGTEAAQRPGVLVDQRFMLSFVGANTNKALHVGHLRNIFLGQALASALTSAGASVQRHSLVGDIGRRVCEAMVGYLVHHDGEDPPTAGMPGDRFVELCSREYPREPAGLHESAQADDPNAEENEVRGDRADEVMQAWLANAPQIRELWSRMRDWVLDSHRRTLDRLGVAIDRYDCESEAIERSLALVEKGLERGLFEREVSGGVVYRTGRSEYTTMVLLRRDGVPTEYARLLGLYDLILDDLGSQASFVEVVGIEWQPAATVLGELLAALRGLPADPCTWAFHGSVTLEGQKMGSSTGEVMWIDDLLDEVASGPGVNALYELAQGAVERDELADVVVRGSFLCSPVTQPLAFAPERLVECGSSSGWTIAHAWCRAKQPQERREDAPVGRAVVVQSQLYRRSLRRAVERRDVGSLASYLLGLAEACLAAPTPGAAAAPALHRAMRALGFRIERDATGRGSEPVEMLDIDRHVSVHAGALPVEVADLT